MSARFGQNLQRKIRAFWMAASATCLARAHLRRPLSYACSCLLSVDSNQELVLPHSSNCHVHKRATKRNTNNRPEMRVATRRSAAANYGCDQEYAPAVGVHVWLEGGRLWRALERIGKRKSGHAPTSPHASVPVAWQTCRSFLPLLSLFVNFNPSGKHSASQLSALFSPSLSPFHSKQSR